MFLFRFHVILLVFNSLLNSTKNFFNVHYLQWLNVNHFSSARIHLILLDAGAYTRITYK